MKRTFKKKAWWIRYKVENTWFTSISRSSNRFNSGARIASSKAKLLHLWTYLACTCPNTRGPSLSATPPRLCLLMNISSWRASMLPKIPYNLQWSKYASKRKARLKETKWWECMRFHWKTFIKRKTTHGITSGWHSLIIHHQVLSRETSQDIWRSASKSLAIKTFKLQSPVIVKHRISLIIRLRSIFQHKLCPNIKKSPSGSFVLMTCRL